MKKDKLKDKDKDVKTSNVKLQSDDLISKDSKSKSKKAKSSKSKSKFKSRNSETASSSENSSKNSIKDTLTSILTRYPDDYLNTSNLFFSNKLGLGAQRIYTTWRSIQDSPINQYYPESAIDRLTSRSNFQIPGIFKITLRPNIDSNSEVSIINSLSSSMFKFIRSANSGMSQYEASDLMIYHLAIMSIYSQMNRIARMYSLLGSSRMMNFYWGDKILESLNVDSYSLTDKQAAIRSAYNVLVRKVNTLALPKYNLIPERWNYLLGSVFTDGTTETSQYYLFDMPYMLEYEGYTDRKGGKLVVKSFSKNDELSDRVDTTGSDLSQLDPILLVRYLLSYVDDLLNDADFNIMNGDMLKAFGNESLYQLVPLEEFTEINPVFDPSILSEINNSNISPFHMKELVQDGKQSYNNDRRAILRTSYTAPSNSSSPDGLIKNDKYWTFHDNAFFNSLTDNPTAEEVIRGTRLMSMAYVNKESYGNYESRMTTKAEGLVLYAGTETVESYSIYSISVPDINGSPRRYYENGTGTMNVIVYNKPFYFVEATSRREDQFKIAKFLMKVTRFAYAPRFTFWYEVEADTWEAWEHGDLQRFTCTSSCLLYTSPSPRDTR